MATPPSQTAAKIAQEALSKCGISSTANDKLQRAERTFLREILSDICTSPGRSFNNRLKSLQSKSVQISVSGKSKYALPTDFDEEISVTVLSGTHSGTAQAGASTTITLESGEDATQEDLEGNYILITSGTGSTGLRQCISYNTSTLVATVDSAWDTTPDNTSVYSVIDSVTEIDEDDISEFEGIGRQFNKSTPSFYNKTFDTGLQYIYFDIPFDAATYGIITRYYANIEKVDLASTIMSTIYTNWFNCLTMGTAMKVAEDEDDSKFAVFQSQYAELKANLLAKETPFGVEFDGFTL
jgi:hypothetical protein